MVLATGLAALTGGGAPITTASAPVMGSFNRYNAASAPLTVTLPALSGLIVGERLAVQKYTSDVSSNTVTFNCAGADKFDNGITTSVVLSRAGDQRELQVVLISGNKRWKLVGNQDQTFLHTDSRGVVYAPTGWPGPINVSNDPSWDITTGYGQPYGHFTTGLGTRFINPDPPDAASGGMVNVGIATQIEGNAGTNPTNKLFLASQLIRLGLDSYNDSALSSFAGATGLEIDLAIDSNSNNINQINGCYVVPILGQALGSGDPVSGTIDTLYMIRADSIQTGYIGGAGLTITDAIGIYASRPLRTPVTNLTVTNQWSLIAEPGTILYSNTSGFGKWVQISDYTTPTNSVALRINSSAGLDFIKVDGTVLATLSQDGNLTADAFAARKSSTTNSGGTTTLTIADSQVQEFTGGAVQTVKLPTTSVTAGMSYKIVNNSAFTVNVQSSAAGPLWSVSSSRIGIFTARIDTPTAAADWNITSGTVSEVTSPRTIPFRDVDANLAADNFIPTKTSTATAAGTTTLTIGSTQTQVFTGSTTQTVLLPTTSVIAGMEYRVINQSTGAVTVQSSGANTVSTLAAASAAAPTAAIYMALVDTPTTATHWRAI